ncbi:MAG: Hepatitis C virus core protein [Cyanobacteriota bacterium]
MPVELKSTASLPDALSLEPPRGYRPMAWLGLLVNLSLLPLTLAFILRDPFWRTVNISVGAGGVLPAAVLGIIASIALLRWLHWGQIVAIVALSLSLAVVLPYAIVRLVLLEPGRMAWAVSTPLVCAVNVAALLFWCRPSIRAYLR